METSKCTGIHGCSSTQEHTLGQLLGLKLCYCSELDVTHPPGSGKLLEQASYKLEPHQSLTSANYFPEVPPAGKGNICCCSLL